MQIRERIRKYLLDGYLLDLHPDELADDSPLLEMGVLDSAGVIELISFLETEFDFIVKDQEITPDNLNSIERIVGFVKKKLKPV